ncbi:MAG: Holliday junction resolvase RuvX [Patescibacteria group bacterium]|nr:Holliday junction resolvase RuvX [Patescibacteria group bacterium]
MSKILAVDVGEKRVGVAISDELQILSFPVATFDIETALEDIANIIKEEGVKKIIIGLPREMSGKMGEKAKESRSFALELGKKLKGIRIDFEDETGTSLLAEERLKKKGVNFRVEKGRVDAEAAAIILEGYLRK